MSDVNIDEETAKVGGTITINVSEKAINYESAMTMPEVVFWLDTVKQMIINKILGE